jgi:hypothetical protein
LELANYFPETGQILISIVKLDGFPVDVDLVKVAGVYAAGSILPTMDDFWVTLEAFDLDGWPIPDVSEKAILAITPIL